jgi:hypothetical protein
MLNKPKKQNTKIFLSTTSNNVNNNNNNNNKHTKNNINNNIKHEHQQNNQTNKTNEWEKERELLYVKYLLINIIFYLNIEKNFSNGKRN